MATNRRRSIHGAEDDVKINISPMIDMVFILLIFFIVTTRFVEETGLAVDKPTPSTDVKMNETKPLNIHISKDGQIRLDGDNIGFTQVRSRVAARMRKEQVPVIIEVEPETASMWMVRVMDEAKLGEAEKISITAAK